MALTATATRGMRKEILRRLSMTTPTIINVSPEKSNIFLAVQEKTSIENYVEKISVVLIRDGKASKKLLIFCHRYDDCYQFYR